MDNQQMIKDVNDLIDIKKRAEERYKKTLLDNRSSLDLIEEGLYDKIVKLKDNRDIKGLKNLQKEIEKKQKNLEDAEKEVIKPKKKN